MMLVINQFGGRNPWKSNPHHLRLPCFLESALFFVPPHHLQCRPVKPAHTGMPNASRIPNHLTAPAGRSSAASVEHRRPSQISRTRCSPIHSAMT